MVDLRVGTPREGIRLLMLSRSARRNALSRDLITALRESLYSAAAEGARAVVIAGAGPARVRILPISKATCPTRSSTPRCPG